ncbi:MAG: NAD(P)-binding domain-containing protein [Pseudomonadota bacterium]|nr:NAD(P)-binding domain-containing protein [Pseudomonadota bacterium]
MLFPRSFLVLIIGSFVAIGSFGLVPAVAETVAMIGTGEVAGALGPEFAALGHRIIYGSRNPDRPAVRELLLRTGKGASATSQAAASAQADIVVLAVPWNAVQEVLSNLGDLSGKIVIDPTNPRVISNDGLRDYAVVSSNAEIIQAMAPEAKVVKAFNTMGWETMIDPASSGGPVTVPLVGNDQEAKDTVAAIIEGMGLEVVDLGPIRYAHVVEGLYLIWGNARVLGTPFHYHFRKN